MSHPWVERLRGSALRYSRVREQLKVIERALHGAQLVNIRSKLYGAADKLLEGWALLESGRNRARFNTDLVLSDQSLILLREGITQVDQAVGESYREMIEYVLTLIGACFHHLEVEQGISGDVLDAAYPEYFSKKRAWENANELLAQAMTELDQRDKLYNQISADHLRTLLPMIPRIPEIKADAMREAAIRTSIWRELRRGNIINWFSLTIGILGVLIGYALAKWPPGSGRFW